MALSEKQRRMLKLAEKRRERRPLTDFKEPVSLRVKHADRERFTNSFPKVLLAIETALAEAFLANLEIVDRDVLMALKSCIQQLQVDDECVSSLIGALERSKAEVIGYHARADEIWTDGLRIIHESVRTHCAGRPHEQNYLQFAVSFVTRAAGSRLLG